MSHKQPGMTSLFVVYGALLLLLAITIVVACFDLGEGNLIAGLLVATTKAVLIMAIFMQLGYANSLTRLVASAGLLWMAILLGLTFADYVTR